MSGDRCADCGRVPGEVGDRVECAVCHRTKKPRGRDAPLYSDLCDSECRGYGMEPHVGSLWPGETRRVFGYGLSADDAQRCYRTDDPVECLTIVVTKLRAEVEALRARAEEAEAELDEANDKHGALEAAADMAQQERDTALNDLAALRSAPPGAP